MSATTHVFEDFLPLTALHARFEAIARGRSRGNSTTAHDMVLARLTANRARAETLGWTGCVLERMGGTGRLLLVGRRSASTPPEVVPDWIPDPPPGDATPPPGGDEPEEPRSARDQARRTQLRADLRRVSARFPAISAHVFERVAACMSSIAAQRYDTPAHWPLGRAGAG
jgi:hypothetical protein